MRDLQQGSRWHPENPPVARRPQRDCRNDLALPLAASARVGPGVATPSRRSTTR